MKLNLLWGTAPRNGYINVDPFGFGDEEKVLGELHNLDDVVDDNEAEEIIAEDVIDYLPRDKVIDTIKHWISKLCHGGTLIIGGVDVYEVARSFANYEIGLDDVNYLLHGRQEEPYQQKLTNFTLMGLRDLLLNNGMRIIKCRGTSFNEDSTERNLYMFIEARRP